MWTTYSRQSLVYVCTGPPFIVYGFKRRLKDNKKTELVKTITDEKYFIQVYLRIKQRGRTYNKRIIMI